MSTWGRWIRQPQSLWARRAMFQVHLWLGIILGLYIFMLSVTGSALVYYRDFGRMFRSPDASKLSTGEWWLFQLVALHDELLLGKDGQWWNGLLSIFATVLVVTGLVIWWPGRDRWKRSLGVRRAAGWRRFNWDLHSAVGFWLFGFMLLWGVSGVYLGMPDPFARLSESMMRPDGTSPLDEPLVWLARLHFGRWRNRWLQAVWAIAGLAPAVMFVTGSVMWWNRVLRPWLRRDARESALGDIGRVGTSVSD